jgi:hypothetical protein
MSFIDLMGNTIWSEQDIVGKTEAMIRSEFSQTDETIMNRKFVGSLTGQYTLSAEEKQQIERFNTVVVASQKEGYAARKDMQLLSKVLVAEPAYQRIQLPMIEQIIEDGIIINQEDIDRDMEERAAAHEIFNSADNETKDLIYKRNP